MQPAVHFVASIAIAFALEIKFSRKYMMILSLGVIGILPDIDHFLPWFNGAPLFHNPIFFCVIPLALILAAFMVENSRYNCSSRYQRFFIAVAVVLVGHLMLDLIAGNVIALDIFSGSTFRLEYFSLLDIGSVGSALDINGIAWLLLGVLALMGNIAQKVMFARTEEFEEFINDPKHVIVPQDEASLAVISSPMRRSAFQT